MLQNSLQIALIGSGNIAHFFGLKLVEANFSIQQVISKNIDHAKELAQKLHCDFSDEISNLKEEIDIVILAINDDAIFSIKENDLFQNKIIIHTAGTITLNDIKFLSTNCACIWPLYSILKNNLPTENNIPLVVNFSNQEIKNNIDLIAKAISNTIFYLSDEQKKTTHLAAVFANNFSNHLFTIAEKIIAQNDIPFDILLPLIKNTIDKLSTKTPFQNQTGPAVRNDTKTIEKHLNMLSDKEKEIYFLLTNSIKSTHLVK